MKKKILKTCPACGNELAITKLSCRKCGIEISGDFEVLEEKENFFSCLNVEEVEFLKKFLALEGNFSKLQVSTGETYATVKNKLNEINEKLGLVVKEEVKVANLLNEKDSKVVKTLKDKLIECGGVSYMPVLKGNPIQIWASSTELGIETAGLKGVVLEWKIFDAIVKKANELGGIMYRGDSAAHSGARIGSEELPVTTIDGFISTKFYGATIGDTTLRRSTYYAGILAWAGIVTNHRSEGKGGFITVNREYRE